MLLLARSLLYYTHSCLLRLRAYDNQLCQLTRGFEVTKITTPRSNTRSRRMQITRYCVTCIRCMQVTFNNWNRDRIVQYPPILKILFQTLCDAGDGKAFLVSWLCHLVKPRKETRAGRSTGHRAGQRIMHDTLRSPPVRLVEKLMCSRIRQGHQHLIMVRLSQWYICYGKPLSL
jgi:hypothetical protein